MLSVSANLKHSHGSYAAAQTDHLAGHVAQGLDKTFAKNEAECDLKWGRGKDKHSERVAAFLKEYQGDGLFVKKGRHHWHFPDFDARRLHQAIKKPTDLKNRLLDYGLKLDRGRYAI